MQTCPCGSNKSLAACCGIFISGKGLPATPEELMRSRYSAYTQSNIDYIENTMRAPANINFDRDEAREWAEAVTWLKLEVIKSEIQGDNGFVEFRAHFSLDNKNHVLHELSEFHRVKGKWFYVSGKGPDDTVLSKPKKIQRNDLCPCGSNLKYKKCCANNS